MISFPKDVVQAHERSKSYIRHTPLEYSPYLSHLVHGDVYLKLENVQKTGSFKFRGAISKMTALTDEEKSKGVVTASTGNHGAACSLAMSLLGVKGKIVVPETVHNNKVDNILNFQILPALHIFHLIMIRIFFAAKGPWGLRFGMIWTL
jgi:threonine dehydratase